MLLWAYDTAYRFWRHCRCASATRTSYASKCRLCVFKYMRGLFATDVFER